MVARQEGSHTALRRRHGNLAPKPGDHSGGWPTSSLIAVDREDERMNTLAMSIVPLMFFVVWLGVVIYVLTLVTRLTRATERIAAALERTGPGPM
jgi:hypothetical protein